MHHFDSSISWKTHSIFKWFGCKSVTLNSSGCKRPLWRTVWMNYDFVPLWPDLNVAAVVFFIVTSFPSNPTWSRTNGSTLLLLVPIDNLCLEAAIFEIQFQLPLNVPLWNSAQHQYNMTSSQVCSLHIWTGLLLQPEMLTLPHPVDHPNAQPAPTRRSPKSTDKNTSTRPNQPKSRLLCKNSPTCLAFLPTKCLAPCIPYWTKKNCSGYEAFQDHCLIFQL